MQSILLTVLLVAVIGLVGAIILTFASRALAVEEDTRVADLVGILPGLNCGSCGNPGCDYVYQESEELPLAEHVPVLSKAAVEPTCTEAGATEEYVCKNCGEVLTASETVPDKGGHVAVVTLEAKEPTCVKVGRTAEEICSVCG